MNTITIRTHAARLALSIVAALAVSLGLMTLSPTNARAYDQQAAGPTCHSRITATYFNSGMYGAYGAVNVAVPQVTACRNNTVPNNREQYVNVAYMLETWNGRAWQTYSSTMRAGYIWAGQSDTTFAPGIAFTNVPSGTYRVTVSVGWYNNAIVLTGFRYFIPAHWGDTICGNLPANRCGSWGSYAVIN